MLGCFPTAYKVDIQPLATLRISRLVIATNTSISRKSRSVTMRQLSIHGNIGASFWWRDAFPHTNQLGFGKRQCNLETSSAEVEFPPPYPERHKQNRFKTERSKRPIKQTSLYNAELYSWWWIPSGRSPRQRTRLAPLFWKIETRLDFKTSSHVQR